MLTASKILRTFKKITFPPGVETAVGEVVEATDSDAAVPACALVAPCVPEEPFALEAFTLPSVPELSVLLCALEALPWKSHPLLRWLRFPFQKPVLH